MDPIEKINTNCSRKSYIESQLITSLENNGPIVGPVSIVVDGIHHHDIDEEEKPIATNVHSSTTFHDKKSRWWNRQSDTISDPKKYPKKRKNTILLIIATASVISPIASTIYYPAVIDMQTYFHASDTTLNSSFSVFTFFTAFFPLVWATFGDLYGRRYIYITSFFITCIGSICCAVSVNVEMFIVFRAFSAIGSSSALSMGAGTIADIYEPHERGKALAYYTCGPLLGPALGPIIGGYLNQGLGWRSNFYFLAIYALVVCVAISIFLPETWRSLKPTIQLQQLQQQYIDHNEKSNNNSTTTMKQDAEEVVQTKKDVRYTVLNKKTKTKFINPIGALKLFLYPNISLCIAFIGVVFFVIYLNMTDFTRSYAILYGFSSGLVGVCYLPNAAGSILGSLIGGRLSDSIYNKRVANAKNKNQDSYPEMRLGGLLFYMGIIIQSLAFIAYGWCIQEEVHFAYGLVCQFIIGLAVTVPNITINTYLVDCFRKKGASAMACNNFARYITAGIGSLVASDILRALGTGPLFTMCGGLILLASINLLVLMKYGKKWSATRVDPL